MLVMPRITSLVLACITDYLPRLEGRQPGANQATYCYWRAEGPDECVSHAADDAIGLIKLDFNSKSSPGPKGFDQDRAMPPTEKLWSDRTSWVRASAL